MSGPEICSELIKSAGEAGAEKVQCTLTETEKQSMGFEGGDISLFRTAKDIHVRVEALFDGRYGAVSLGGYSPEAAPGVITELMAAAGSSAVDPARDISASGEGRGVKNAAVLPDKEKMYARVDEFLREVGRRYPGINFRTSWLSFTREKKIISNSAGFYSDSETGRYELLFLFCAKNSVRSSPFNLFWGYSRDLDRALLEWGGADRLLGGSGEHLNPRRLDDKFIGDIIVSPECLGSFLNFIAADLGDQRVLSGSGVYRGMLGKPVAHPDFSMRSEPLSDALATGYIHTRDGARAENVCIIEKGVLRSFLTSRYASLKSGVPFSSNDGGCYVVDAGSSSFEEMVRSTKRGLLVAAFAGTDPNEKGDFSGVAKSSFYIENGKIAHPVSEVMISGNIPEMLKNIRAISEDRVNSGDFIFPWISFSGINISGK